MNPAPSSPSQPGATRRASDSAGRSPYPRRRRRWGWWILGGLVVLGIVGALTARPAWRAVKSYRAAGFLQQAKDHAAKDEWMQAFERTRAALQLAPLQPEVLRYTANLYGRFGQEAALAYYEKLLGLPQATPQDREDYAALAVNLGMSEIASAQVEKLLAPTNPSARALTIGAQYHAQRRQMGRAVELARRAVTAAPDNPTNTLILASYLSTSSTPAARNEARQLLWPFARADGPHQFRALSSLLLAPNSPRTDREEVERILAAKTNRTLEEELLWLETRVSLDPSQRNRVADELIERHGRGAGEEMTGTAAWLNRQQLFARTRDLVLPDVALKNEKLFRLRYEALMGLGDERGAYDFILTKSAPGEPLQLEFLRCSTAAALKDDAAVESHLRNMLELARNQPLQLRAVAEFALRQRKTEIANEANRLLSRNPREAITAFRTLLRSTDAQGETWAARDYARKLAALNKNEPGIDLQIAYYDLLLNEKTDQAYSRAKALHEAEPDDFNRRAVLALAHLRRGEKDAAANLIQGQVVTWNRLPPGLRAVVVASLGARNQQDVAAKLISRLPIALLKPEERELIRPYLSAALALDAGAAGADETREEKPEAPEAPEKL